MKLIASGEWTTGRMETVLTAKKRELQKPKKSEIDVISELVGDFKTGLEKRDKVKIKKISSFAPGRQQFVDQLMAQYRTMSVTISDFQYIAKNHLATANVELSDLVDKNGHNVTPGAWNKFSIKVVKDARQQFKVYW